MTTGTLDASAFYTFAPWLKAGIQAQNLTNAITKTVQQFTLTGLQGPRSDVLTGDFPLNATAPRITLSNGRSVADPFFNPAYPRARRRNVDMLAADTVHLVNMRVAKTFAVADGKKLEISGDVFNRCANSSAAVWGS